MSFEKTFNKKLLVEGGDDLHVVGALCQKFALPHNFNIIDTKSVDQLLIQLPSYLKQSDYKNIGIVIDADNNNEANLEKRWKKVSVILKSAGFEIPESLPSNGLITTNDRNQTVGVWIMPNNNINGMLEDFIAFLIPENDDLKQEVEDILSKIEATNLNKYKDIHRSKAFIHTWLAWQEDPGTPMGLSITKKYLNPEEENCIVFVDWLRRLFN